MLNTKTFKLEKPKKGDGWAKIVEWNRRWNKILSVIFGILSFSLLFAIVLANILHTDYKNYEIVTTTTTSTAPSTTTTTTSTISTTTTEEELLTTSVDSTTEEIPSTTTETFPIVEPETTTITEMFTDSTTIVFPTLPPVYTTSGETRITTVTFDTTEATSSGILPDSSCNLDEFECKLGHCVINIRTCTVVCSNSSGNEKVTSYYVDLLAKLRCDDKSIELELSNCEFTLNTLQAKWLDIKPKVLNLSLDSKLEIIEPGAFSSAIFSDTHTITIRNSEITRLGNVFEGLSSLATLSFYGSQFQEITDDAFALLPNLQTLNVDENAYPIRLENLTAGTVYPSITAISVRFNDIRSVPKQSFVGVPRLRSIYFHGSRITHIDGQAFEGAGDELMDVHLNDNLLSTVESGVFSHAIKLKSLHIYLEGNPWYCVCAPGMQELQTLMNNQYTSQHFPGNVTCDAPVDVKEINIKVAELGCGTTRDFSTPEVSTTTVKEPPPTLGTTGTSIFTPVHNTTELPVTTTASDIDTPVDYSNSFTRPTRFPLLQCQDEILSTTIIVEGGHQFNLTEVDEGVVMVRIHPNFDEPAQLFWFMNTPIEFQPGLPYERTMGCSSDFGETFVVEDMTPNSIYTFCMLSLSKYHLTPFDCLSIYVLPAKADRTWLKNKDRIIAYAVVVVSVFLVFLLGIILTYICVRYQSMRNRKKVVHPELRSDVLMMPPLPKRNGTKNPVRG